MSPLKATRAVLLGLLIGLVGVAAIVRETPVRRLTHGLDAVLLHPLVGPLILGAILFVMFQAVFAWSAIPADALEAGA